MFIKEVLGLLARVIDFGQPAVAGADPMDPWPSRLAEVPLTGRDVLLILIREAHGERRRHVC